MAGMGPAPKPEGQRRRRNAQPGTTTLPAAGRRGRAPDWPLPPDLEGRRLLAKLADQEAAVLGKLDEEQDSDKADLLRRRLAAIATQVEVLQERIDVTADLERTLWAAVWKTPQAVEWSRHRWTRTVAQYVRWKAQAELGNLDAGKEARQYEDRLGLNDLSLLRLRWQIADEPEPKPPGKSSPVTVLDSYRRDLGA